MVALTIVALGLSGGLRTAHAQDPDGVITGIDMDPTGNTATTLGTIDRCRAVSAGDVIDIDVFVSDLDDPPNCHYYPTDPNTPFCESILNSGFHLGGWPASGNDAVAPRITAQNNLLFLNAAPGSMVVDFSDTVPDGTDPHLVSIPDMGTAEYARAGFHQGVIGRYTLSTAGAAAGLYGLTLENVFHGRDPPPGGLVRNEAILDSNFTPKYGLLAVGVPCPSFADPVGGSAELPDVAGDSGWSAGTYAALAGGLAAALVALTVGGWYARRRWSR